jgi:ketosteroid isomerase-like protein
VAIAQRASVDVAFLESFGDAFNRHDLDGIMAHMTEDCVFYRSSGPEAFGTKYAGQAAARAAFEEVMRLIQGVQFQAIRHAVFGDRGISEWTMTGALASDGSKVEVLGLDLFEFRDGKIAVKDSYTKRRV